MCVFVRARLCACGCMLVSQLTLDIRQQQQHNKNLDSHKGSIEKDIHDFSNASRNSINEPFSIPHCSSPIQHVRCIV